VQCVLSQNIIYLFCSANILLSILFNFMRSIKNDVILDHSSMFWDDIFTFYNDYKKTTKSWQHYHFLNIIQGVLIWNLFIPGADLVTPNSYPNLDIKMKLYVALIIIYCN